jgi:hypothetical protein
MKTYFIDDPFEWLDTIIPDLIDDLINLNMLDAGFIYSPYIPPIVSPPITDLDDLTVPVGDGIRVRTLNTKFDDTIKLSSVGVAPGEPKRNVLTFDKVMGALDSFTKRRPNEAPGEFSSVNRSLQETAVRRSLTSLTDAGILNFDADQRGWWRPEILDAMAALPDDSAIVEDEPLIPSPLRSETQSPSDGASLGPCSGPPRT